MIHVDVAIIGAGAVGLASAAELSSRWPNVIVFERHHAIGQETSSRSSEVIHAGLYYPIGSMKARLCAEGRRALYALAESASVAHRRCGKLIVAVDQDEVGSLEQLAALGEANGVPGLRMLGASDLRALEPHVSACAALLSPETGIVDSHALMEVFLLRARENGAAVCFGAEVESLERLHRQWRIGYRESSGPGTVTCRAVVNCAGLSSQAVMRQAGLDPAALGLVGYLCKGEYFVVRGARRWTTNGLVYPSPKADQSGLGIHTVIDLAGGMRLGTNAFYVDRLDYAVDPGHVGEFLAGVRQFLPYLEEDDLIPGFAGIRPKLAGPGQPVRDFHIAHEAASGAPGFFNLAGIESPGLTASPAIGRMVADMVADWLIGGD